MTEAIASEIKLIVFQLNTKEYAIPVNQVRSIEKVEHITRVPHTDKFVKGVLNLRGVITPIIDLRSRFGLEESSYSDSTRVIIVGLNELEVGFIVDLANDVIDIPVNSIEPPPEVVGVKEAEYINGVAKVGKRLLILIDLEKILKIEERSSLQGIEG
ncbi:purine-binding chemotaxis protein CheW [Bacillus sp. FJAT-49705]|uniref:Purine-binding chemotaxis protein CheW n=1 Tax=Cytobacillus citreus TaxID=2833586 RepID=A0ABS5NN70_9BACI|nr:chemotaxis protein CheW [Cytobacillus citreus]MBS4189252.1 purine-binding chemotaxis protein CheW [Cytobacillus citreus]